MGRPVTEQDAPRPIELYGKSKLRGEEVLLAQSGRFRHHRHPLPDHH